METKKVVVINEKKYDKIQIEKCDIYEFKRDVREEIEKRKKDIDSMVEFSDLLVILYNIINEKTI